MRAVKRAGEATGRKLEPNGWIESTRVDGSQSERPFFHISSTSIYIYTSRYLDVCAFTTVLQLISAEQHSIHLVAIISVSELPTAFLLLCPIPFNSISTPFHSQSTLTRKLMRINQSTSYDGSTFVKNRKIERCDT